MARPQCVLSAYTCGVCTERQHGVCLLARCVVNFLKREHCGGVTAASVVPSQTKTQDIAIPTFSPETRNAIGRAHAGH